MNFIKLPDFSKVPTQWFVFFRVILGALYAVLGFTKLMEPIDTFTRSIEAYELVSASIAGFFAPIFLWVEYLIGVMLIIGLWTRFCCAALWAMNTLFILVITQALIRGLNLEDCGCFGDSIGLKMPIWGTLIMDGVCFVLFFMLFRHIEKTKKISIDGYLG